MRRRRFANRNAVRGCPGWFYGLLLRNSETRSFVFDVFNSETGERIEGLRASLYPTTALARKMGDKRRGYQHVAQLAIREREASRR